MRDRAFGVEIECGYNGPREGACTCSQDDLHAWGCECGADDDYGNGCRVAVQLLTDNGFEAWTDHIHEDGTEVEIPSPILRGNAGLRELESVMKLLSQNGFYVTDNDGLHVHHDAPEFIHDEGLTARLLELWEENLPVIDGFVAGYRRGGRYWACSSYKDDDDFGYTSAMRQEAWEAFKSTKKLESLGGLGRSRSLNISGLRRGRGTLEFRLHEGTLNFEDVAAWIHFGQAFIEYAKKHKSVRVCSSALELVRALPMAEKAGTRLLEKAGVGIPVAA